MCLVKYWGRLDEVKHICKTWHCKSSEKRLAEETHIWAELSQTHPCGSGWVWVEQCYECFSGTDAEKGISAAAKERVAVIFNLFSGSIKHLSHVSVCVCVWAVKHWVGCVGFLSHIINQCECVFLVNEDVTSVDCRTRLRYGTFLHTTFTASFANTQ